jgi:hypothetical protein
MTPLRAARPTTADSPVSTPSRTVARITTSLPLADCEIIADAPSRQTEARPLTAHAALAGGVSASGAQRLLFAQGERPTVGQPTVAFVIAVVPPRRV